MRRRKTGNKINGDCPYLPIYPTLAVPYFPTALRHGARPRDSPRCDSSLSIPLLGFLSTLSMQHKRC